MYTCTSTLNIFFTAIASVAKSYFDKLQISPSLAIDWKDLEEIYIANLQIYFDLQVQLMKTSRDRKKQ